jgi:hypothetical protein
MWYIHALEYYLAQTCFTTSISKNTDKSQNHVQWKKTGTKKHKVGARVTEGADLNRKIQGVFKEQVDLLYIF